MLAPGGGILRANRALAELSGRAAADLVGLQLSSLCEEADLPEIERALADARAGEASECEVRMPRADGGGVFVWWSLAADRTGQVHAAGRQVSSSRRLQRLLSETQRIARVGGWELDLTSSELFWTEETYRLHEVDPESFRPDLENAIAFYTPESQPQITAAVEEALRVGTPWDLELQIVTAKGRTRDVRAVGRVDGESARVFGAFQDITERRLLEEQLRHSQKLEAIGRLAGGVAHDFNNLLTVILGNLDLIARGNTSTESTTKSLAAIRTAAEQACHVTGQLLAFARKRVRAPEPIALGRRVLELTDLLSPLVGERVTLETDVDGGEAVVRMDPGHLELVLVNLVVNARDAMPQGGCVTLGVREEERQVRLWVEDTGTGIDVGDASKVFEPFFTTKEPERGTGLGLATCHGIVEQSGGSIAVESAPGRGTTFRIVLPRQVGEVVPVGGPMPVPEARTVESPRTVLLVEDEPLVRDLVQKLLERDGYGVLAAGDYVEALALLDSCEGPIDAVVADLVLPGEDGLDVVAAVREQLGDLPALLMSGYHEVALELSATCGKDGFLEKPFTSEALAEALAGLFARYSDG